MWATEEAKLSNALKVAMQKKNWKMVKELMEDPWSDPQRSICGVFVYLRWTGLFVSFIKTICFVCDSDTFTVVFGGFSYVEI